MEISKENSTSILPDFNNTILDGVISYNPHALNDFYSLLINYNTTLATESLTIPLRDDVFDLTILWINAGCLYNSTCVTDSGQIAIILESANSSYFNLLEGLKFNSSNGSSYLLNQTDESLLWKAFAVYWGELDNVNMSHNIILSTPN